MSKGEDYYSKKRNKSRTKLVFRSLLKLLVCHQLLDFSGHDLYMIDNQVIKIGELVRVVDHKLAGRLTG